MLAEQFLEYFDGFSIGSNDMTQLTLGLDRDSGLIAHLFDERNEAVKAMLSMAINACTQAEQVHRHLRPGPFGSPGTRRRWLLDQGIESMSLNPDTVSVMTWLYSAVRKSLSVRIGSGLRRCCWLCASAAGERRRATRPVRPLVPSPSWSPQYCKAHPGDEQCKATARFRRPWPVAGSSNSGYPDYHAA